MTVLFMGLVFELSFLQLSDPDVSPACNTALSELLITSFFYQQQHPHTSERAVNSHLWNEVSDLSCHKEDWIY